jgi:ribosome biogenesis GTPase
MIPLILSRPKKEAFMKNHMVEGLVIKHYSGFYYIQDPQHNLFECTLRGKLKVPVLSGDRVLFTPIRDSKGVVEEILPRKNQLYRPKVANVTLVLIVMAFNKPAPDIGLLDRLIFLSFYYNLIPYIILNKCDLEPDPKSQMILDYYPTAGFNYLTTSAANGTGINQLQQVLRGHITVLAGPSGTGKSSLLNALTSGLAAKTQEVSKKIGRGKHTTRHVELYPIDNVGYLVDTPGFSVIDLPRIRRNELSAFFPDFTEHAGGCFFKDCLHYKEEQCSIRSAVEEGKIADFRYQNYINMLEEIMNNERYYR